MTDRPVAAVTGANRGLGRETVRQLAAAGWTVVLTARDPAKAEAAAAALGQHVVPATLDVTDAEQIAALADWIRDRFGRLDALVNNAAVIADDPRHPSALVTPPDAVLESLRNNSVSAYAVTQALLPLLREGDGGNVVFVSSGMGALSDMGGGYPAYRVSKTAMLAFTRIFHEELQVAGADVRVNAVCPGWVKTDMGGAGATREVPDGARGIVWAATLGPGGPSGGFFRDGQPIPW